VSVGERILLSSVMSEGEITAGLNQAKKQ